MVPELRPAGGQVPPAGAHTSPLIFPYYAQSFVQGLLFMVALLMSYTLGPNRS